jgi:hypothetical protein
MEPALMIKVNEKMREDIERMREEVESLQSQVLMCQHLYFCTKVQILTLEDP